jgi:hypothetical protein
MSDQRRTDKGSDNFEKRGGYPSPAKPIAKLPKAPAGPAPGAKDTDGKPRPASG